MAASSASAQRKRPLGSAFSKQKPAGEKSSGAGPASPRPDQAEGDLGTSRSGSPAKGAGATRTGATRSARATSTRAAETRTGATKGNAAAAKAEPTTATYSRSGKPITREENRAIAQRSVVDGKRTASEAARRKASTARSAADQAEAKVSGTSQALRSAENRLSRAIDEVRSLDGEIKQAVARRARVEAAAEEATRLASSVNKKKNIISQFIGTFSFGLGGRVDVKSEEQLVERAIALIEEGERLDKEIPRARERLNALRRAGRAIEGEVEDAREADAAAREELEPLARTSRKLEGEASAADRELSDASSELEAAEQDARVAVERFLKRRVLQDQHRQRLVSGRDNVKVRKSVARYRTAAKRFKLSSFIEPKPNEFSQDAMASVPEEGVFAISDGVSNSEFPGEFARSLVKAYTARIPSTPEEFNKVLEEAQKEWDGETADRIASAKENYYARNVKWVAGATFLGARIEGTGARRRLKLMGIGDANLFIVRKGKILRAWPQERADQFSNETKGLVSNAPLKGKIPTTSIPVQEGDEVFMTTDALAAWVLTEAEAGRDPFPPLRDIKNQREMNAFVEKARDKQLRGRSQMNEDDTALVRFTIPSETEKGAQ